MGYLRSALFMIMFAVFSTAVFVISLPTLAMPRLYLVRVANWWARCVLAGLRWVVGLRCEVRGRPPEGPVLVASKHFSMWETVALVALLRDPAIVLKRELMRIPLYGWYTHKMRMIPIDREAGASAIRAMSRTAHEALKENRPILIFPEGTRKRRGDPPDYKPGVAALYALAGVPCVPVAHNSGLFWTGGLKKPGTVTVEFLEPIPAGMNRRDFMAILENRIEAASNRLLAQV